MCTSWPLGSYSKSSIRSRQSYSCPNGSLRWRWSCYSWGCRSYSPRPSSSRALPRGQAICRCIPKTRGGWIRPLRRVSIRPLRTWRETLRQLELVTCFGSSRGETGSSVVCPPLPSGRVVAAAWMALGAQRGGTLAAPEGRPGVAVLPFVNRSADELGVEYVLEGGLLRAGNQVRLNVQLIEGATDSHVWAETYDRAMTVENLLAIQTEIVAAVVREIRGVISPEESDFLADLPTQNSEAYEMYLRGEDWLNRGGLTAQEFTNAARFYEAAAELDPTFALAHAKAASAHVQMFFQGHDVTPARLERAQIAMDRALQFDRMHPQVREAYGDFLYYGRRAYDEALTEYQAALEKLPSSVTLITRVAAIQRRQGLWEESLDGLLRVREMEPRSRGHRREPRCEPHRPCAATRRLRRHMGSRRGSIRTWTSSGACACRTNTCGATQRRRLRHCARFRTRS